MSATADKTVPQRGTIAPLNGGACGPPAPRGLRPPPPAASLWGGSPLAAVQSEGGQAIGRKEVCKTMGGSAGRRPVDGWVTRNGSR